MTAVESPTADVRLRFFLIVHDQRTRVTRVEEFDDAMVAESAYDRAERDVASDDGDLEFVLVGSDSLATVQQTHASYFRGQRLVTESPG